MLVKVDLSLEAFKEWLQNQPKERRFKRASNCNCPIAEYVTETSGLELVSVGSYRLSGYNRETFVVYEDQLPIWAEIFIGRFDDATHYNLPCGGLNPPTICPAGTIEECISILKDLKD